MGGNLPGKHRLECSSSPLRRLTLPKAAATSMAKPASGPARSRPPRRTGAFQLGFGVIAIATLASALLVALPSTSAAGESLPTYVPLAPEADAHRAQTGLALDAPFQVQFTKPMNESSVVGALTVRPDTALRLQWDATSEILSILPAGHWEPYTNYTVDVTNAATDQEGLSLQTEIHTSFQSGSPTAGSIAATLAVDNQIGPNSAFQLTFDRPVRLSTVLTRFAIKPAVDVTIAGDDPTDTASQVFTMTPKAPLAGNTDYTVSFADGGTDAAGAALQHVDGIDVTTMAAPAVYRFRPQDGGVTYDTNQVISVRFTTQMDRASTAAAFTVTANGKTVAGSLSWSEGDTVLALVPRSSFKVNDTIVARVSTAARSITGMHIAKAASATAKVSPPQSREIPFTGGIASSTSPWYASEVYYLNLMNCTRTGGWVTRSGACSTVTHHTLPAQSNNIILDAGISNKVSRPYAKYMADNRVLDHYLNGTTPHSRLCAQGWCGPSWGENIASPSTSGQAGMIDIEIFYQNEYPCRCEHYFNIMDPYFRRAGIGVWVSSSSGAVRVSIDFYG
jgi:hypothetical protein